MQILLPPKIREDPRPATCESRPYAGVGAGKPDDRGYTCPTLELCGQRGSHVGPTIWRREVLPGSRVAMKPAALDRLDGRTLKE
jgi:hypothetical protein